MTKTNYGAITAVKALSRDCLYTGQGRTITKYSLSGEKQWSQRLFGRNKIHGIDIDDNGKKMLVFGGDSILVTDLECSSRDERSVGDWICDAKFGAENTIYVLTAHNRVLVLDSESLKVKDIVTCSENSLLYSGSLHVTQDDSESVLVASGTVLHGIYIWKLSDGQIMHNFTDHEGSIFDVKISPDSAYVISCSDDRFVKLFDLKAGKLVGSGFGHGARIWQVGFYGENGYVSSSEDSTAILWSYDESRGVLEPVKQFPGHVGKNMWCFDILEKSLITGGGDGRWREFDLEVDQVTEYNYEQVIGNSGAFKNFINLSFDKTAVGTALGEVYLVDRSGDKVSWSLIFQNDSLKSLNLMAGWPGSSFVAVGSRFGQVFVIDTESKAVSEIKVFEGKVSGMLTRDLDGVKYLLATSQNDKDDNVLIEVGKEDQTKRYKAVDTFPVTCFDVNSNGNVIMGSRFGALAYFDSVEAVPVITRKAINAETVTDIMFTDNSHVVLTTKNGFYGKLDLSSRQFSLLNKSSQNSIFKILSLSPLITCGFKTNSFVISDESSNAQLFSADCGGAHRSWDVLFADNKVLFNFVRKSIMCEIASTVIPVSSYYSHGREVRAIDVNGSVVASGAEDTNVILSEVRDGQLYNLYTYRKHTSGIQTLKWVTSELLISSSAREELFIWKFDASEKTLTPWLSLPRGDNPDLRIMDFVYKACDGGFELLCVYSDSSLRLWKYDGSSFSLVSDLKYTQHCLLNVDLVEEDKSALISATDGSLSVYELPSLRPKSHVYAHQSSVRFCRKGNLIFSGGDDNKLVVTELKNGQLQVLASIEKAHSSTITEVALLDGDEADIVSVSVDQNVRKWKFVDGELKMVFDEFTTVADTGCVCPYEGGLLIGGAGLDYWRT
ncbi:Regulator of Ty1 transposition protein 10 [Yarrowia sp. C11]|nr:Regulator of Ty1 transposition protein 10 [Yarrowia sp. C11]